MDVKSNTKNPENTSFAEFLKIIWRTPFLILIGISSIFQGISIGVFGALIGRGLPFLEIHEYQGIIIYLMAIATSLGAFSGACMSHKVGRKKALIVSNLLLFQGCYLFLITPSHLINLIGRLMIGVGLGIGCLTSPIYITETCPPQISGRINSIRDFFTSIGITFLNLMNLQYGSSSTWNLMIYLVGLSSLIQISFFYIIMPESPTWLLMQNMVTEAYKVLLKLYPADEVPKVIDNLKSIVRPNETTDPTIVNIWRTAVRTKQFRKCLCLGVVVQLASQAAGLILISYERPILSRSAGVSKMAESTVTLILQLIGEFVNLILQDGIAIRRLILITIFILSLDLLGIGFILYCIYQGFSSSGSLSSVAVLLIGIYYIVYPVGLGTAPWLVNASMYNVWYRGLGGAIAAVARWGANLVVTVTFLPIMKKIEDWGVCFLYAGLMVVGFIVIYLFPFEEMEKDIDKSA